MITQLSGRLVTAELTEAVVDVNGVGYAVSVPMSTYDKLPRPGGEVVLLTHLQVREDAMQLFGFWTDEERRLFRLLITVSGVGPRLALNILSCMSVRGFCRTIAAGDVKGLSRVNGIGKRSAERLVVELKERVEEIEPAAALAGADQDVTGSREAQDAIAALETLGFKGEVARRTVRKLCAELPADQRTAEQLIRKALAAVNA